MKEEEQTPPVLHRRHHYSRITAAFHRQRFTKPTAFAILLLLSFFLGYFSAPTGTQVIHHSSSPPPPPQPTSASITTATELDHYRFATHCADPIPSKLVRQTILDRVFDGISPYHNFPPPHITSLHQKRIRGWGSNGAVFENLIRKVRPKTIIEIGTFLGASAIHMAQLTRQLGLQTQILCIDDFRGWPGFRDQIGRMNMQNGDVMLLYQFMQNVVYVNETESVLFVPFSTGSTLEALCGWGIFADLIEVDAGHDFHSAWSDINRAYKLLSPGGVIFGHDYFTAADNKGVRRAVNLFARVNRLRIQVDGQHWVIHSI